jgi:neutral ceramidase
MRSRLRIRVALAAAGLAGLLALALPVPALALQAGVGRSDITPPTGFYTMGYVRSDAVARGQHTRLFTRAIVLEQHGRKFALVATDLGFTPGGLLVGVAHALAARGFSEQNVLISASHTHSGPAGFSSFGSDNFVAPTTGTPTSFSVATDRQLLGFMVNRVALAVARADAARGPAKAGWGDSSLFGVTQNRSLEALLADFGLDLPYGQGRISMVPGGYARTIDPRVDVLRVDRIRAHRLIPMGGWLVFADHGTVDPYTFGVYSADHQGVAERVFEAGVRQAAHLRASDPVVGAYGNSDAGDMSAGLGRRGPAKTDEVGHAEARAMLDAWRRAGTALSGRLVLRWRWTRMCFCGQVPRGDGPVASQPAVGLPFLTGSEENRGPLYDVQHVNYEGFRLPFDVGPQGRKIQAVSPPAAQFAVAVPLFAVQVGDRLLASVPGEMTVEMGRRTRTALLAAARQLGVRRIVLAGYANEYIHYFTTPEEYEKQHYEGGSTLFGKYSSDLLRDGLVDLTARMAAAAPAPAPYPFDATDGVSPDPTPYPTGPASAAILRQPQKVERLDRAAFSWQGGLRGFDRSLDRPFVTVERRTRRGVQRVADDLGLLVLWRVDDQGRFDAEWQLSAGTPTGRYRFVVTANHYRLASSWFAVAPTRTLHARLAGARHARALIALDYPPLDDAVDLVSDPPAASGGRLVVLRGGRRLTVRARAGYLDVPLAGASRLRILSGTDRFGNVVAGLPVWQILG